ncbi:MAG: TonB-dependent receptor [Sinimarinibacterium sp.]|jgi:iron complex outermembrane receptor protein
MRAAWAAAMAALSLLSVARAQDDLDFLLAPTPAEPEPAKDQSPASTPKSDTASSEDTAKPAAQQGGGEAATTSGGDAVAPAGEPPVANAEGQVQSDEKTTRVRRSMSRVVEEIVVTAQKREESLKDVPISVQAFSAEALDARGVGDISTLQAVTPGLNVSTQAGFTVVFIRGIGANGFITADPSVAYYVDNVYIPASQNLGEGFGDVERVEVLKGPQGTLFGRNAVGGAISVITKKPSLSESSGSLSLGYETDINEYFTRVSANVPLFDTLAVAGGVSYRKGEFWVDGTHDGGKPFEPEEERIARLKALWQPAENLAVNVTAYYNARSGTSSLMSAVGEPTTLGLALGAYNEDTRHPELSSPTYFRKHGHILSGDIVYNTDWLDVKVYGSKQMFRMPDAGYDFDGSPQPLLRAQTDSFVSDVETGEFQLVSNESSWGSDWWKWIVGTYYFHSIQGFDPVGFGVGTFDLDGTEGESALGLPPGIFQLIDSVLDPLGIAAPDARINAYGLIGKKSVSIFGQTTFDFTEWMALTLGGRWTEESHYIVKARSTIHNTDEGETTLLDFPTAQDGSRIHTISTFKPKISFEFRPFSDDSLVYVSYQEAFKSGTYNALNIYQAPAYVEPEEMTAYEVGIKTTLFDETVSLSAAAFHYDITNLQVQYISIQNGGIVSFENAGSARVKGLEFDTTTEVFPSVFDSLVFTLGAVYLDAYYTDYKNATGWPNNLGVLTTNNDFTGNQVERTPKLSGSSSLSKTWGVPGGTFELAGDVYYTSEFFFEAGNDDESRQEGYALLGARASYWYERWDLRLTAFGKNITNEEYDIGRLAFDMGPMVTPGRLGSYGVKMQWNF